MSGLFAAQIGARFAHPFRHVAVADLGAVQMQAILLHQALQPEVGHDRRDDAAAAQPSVCNPGTGDQRQYLVSIHDVSIFVGDNQPVGVAIQRDSDMRAVPHHLRAQEIRHRGAAAPVDVEAVRGHADRHDCRAKFPQHRGCDSIGSAIGTIEDDLQIVQSQPPRETGLHRLDIPPPRVFEPRCSTQLRRRCHAVGEVAVHQRFDLKFPFVGQFVAVRTEQLDAVIFVSIMRRGDHHPQIGPQAAGQHRDGWRRQWAQQGDVHTRTDETGGQSRLDQIARQACIFADHDFVSVRPAREQQARGLSQAQGDISGHGRGIGLASDTVRAEQASGLCHRNSILRFPWFTPAARYWGSTLVTLAKVL